MKAFICQFDIAWEDKSANFAKVRALVDRASPPADSLIVLPEMFATGFSMNVAALAEAPDGPTQQFLTALASERRCHVVAGVVTRAADGRGQNEAVVIDPSGRETARYRKRQPFTLGGEGRAYAAGDEIVLANIGPFVTAPTVCYDLRFPETFRRPTQRGAQLLINISSWPSVRVAHWRALLTARAIENQAYVIGVNRTGKDPHLSYNGQSLIIDPMGRILADPGDAEGVFSADLDLQTLLDYRRELPFLADIRKDDMHS